MEKTQIKLFGPCEKKKDLEIEINTFLKTKESFYIDDIQFNVVRNFLPNTTLGEYQQLWYGMVSFSEEINEEN